MSNEPYTPTTSQVLFNYVLMGGRRAGFVRWLAERDARITAAAEQRGAARGWDEAITAQIQRLISGDPDVVRFQMPANPYRADRMEGDDHE